MLLNHTNRRRVLATVATTAALAGAAPAALAMPPDGVTPSTVPEQDRVKVVRVQVDQGLDWADAGIGAAGMLAIVLAGFGGAHLLNSPSRVRSAAHS
jgi:hypothetical protein